MSNINQQELSQEDREAIIRQLKRYFMLLAKEEIITQIDPKLKVNTKRIPMKIRDKLRGMSRVEFNEHLDELIELYLEYQEEKKQFQIKCQQECYTKKTPQEQKEFLLKVLETKRKEKK